MTDDPTGPEEPGSSTGEDKQRLHIVGDEGYGNWDEIYLDNVVRVYRLLFSKVGNRHDAEDLTTEVFLAALGPMRVSASRGEVRAYLAATCRTVLATYWRHRLGLQVTSIDPDLAASYLARPSCGVRRSCPSAAAAGGPAGSPPPDSRAPVPGGVLDQGSRPRDGDQRRQRQGAPAPGVADGGRRPRSEIMRTTETDNGIVSEESDDRIVSAEP